MDGWTYGVSTTIVPVDCAGVVSAASILRAFSERADGVLVAACGTGDCHCLNGNESCEKVVQEARELMQLAGIVPDRLRLSLSSDVDGKRFAELLDAFAADVSRLNGRARGRRRAKEAVARKRAKKAAVKRQAGRTPTKTAATKKATKRPARKTPTKKAATKKATKRPARRTPTKTAATKKATKRPARKTPTKTAATKKATAKRVKKTATKKR
jgi:coenzyme F420-reducing hydrogenase delta subunit